MIVTIDPKIPVRWLELVGSNPATLDRLEALAREQLAEPSSKELEAAARALPYTDGAISRLALGAPRSARAAVLEAARAGLRCSSAAARMDAALAVVSAQLSDAAADVERAIAVEGDAEVRCHASMGCESAPTASLSAPPIPVRRLQSGTPSRVHAASNAGSPPYPQLR